MEDDWVGQVRAELKKFGQRFSNDSFGPGAALYGRLAMKFAETSDTDLLSVVRNVHAGQPRANLLFASMQFALLKKESPLPQNRHSRIREMFAHPEVFQNNVDQIWDDVVAFIRENFAFLSEQNRTRMVQTNAIERCGPLVVGLVEAARRIDPACNTKTEIATIEIGASSGLLMHWPKYRIDYGNGIVWQSNEQEEPLLTLNTSLKGDKSIQLQPIGQSWCKGIDLHPIDLKIQDELDWQKCLVWPGPTKDERERHLDIVRSLNSDIILGDALELLPEILKEAPTGVPLIVYASAVLYQMPEGSYERIVAHISNYCKSTTSSVGLVVFGRQDFATQPYASLIVTICDASGKIEEVELAKCHPHGHSMQLL